MDYKISFVPNPDKDSQELAANAEQYLRVYNRKGLVNKITGPFRQGTLANRILESGEFAVSGDKEAYRKDVESGVQEESSLYDGAGPLGVEGNRFDSAAGAAQAIIALSQKEK